MKLFDSKMLVFLGIKGLFNKCLIRTFCHSIRYIWREISTQFCVLFLQNNLYLEHINFKGTSSLRFACLYV